jgi:hypothetical protein
MGVAQLTAATEAAVLFHSKKRRLDAILIGDVDDARNPLRGFEGNNCVMFVF